MKIKIIQRLLVLLASSFLLTACSLLDWAVAGDSVSTYAAIQTGFGGEANPILNALTDGKAAPSSIVAAGLAYAGVDVVRRFAPESCVPFYRATVAAKFGATANNLAVLAGASGNVPIAVGLLAGVLAHRMEATHRDASAFCGIVGATG